MSKSSDEFGEWRTAPDGTAHYVIAGGCLCGVKVKKWGGPPERKAGPLPGLVGKFVTPFCLDCVDLNVTRWAEKGGKSIYVLSQRQFWWNQRSPKRD